MRFPQHHALQIFQIILMVSPFVVLAEPAEHGIQAVPKRNFEKYNTHKTNSKQPKLFLLFMINYNNILFLKLS